VKTHMCVTALDSHSLQVTVRCSQRPVYTGTNTRYASMHTNSVSEQHHSWNDFTQTHGVWTQVYVITCIVFDVPTPRISAYTLHF